MDGWFSLLVDECSKDSSQDAMSLSLSLSASLESTSSSDTTKSLIGARQLDDFVFETVAEVLAFCITANTHHSYHSSVTIYHTYGSMQPALPPPTNSTKHHLSNYHFMICILCKQSYPSLPPGKKIFFDPKNSLVLSKNCG